MRTEILKIKGSWKEVLNDCRLTVGKEPIDKEPSHEWKRKILISEHSPIRDMQVKFMWKSIPYWVAMHWKTHKWESRTVSQRNDRQDQYDREKAPQDAPVTFVGEPNAQHLIDTMRKRLCHQASAETRAYAEDFKRTLRKVEPELSDVLVPNCVYRCGCPEMKFCQTWQKMMKETDSKIITCLIDERYAIYNYWFYGVNDNEDA